MTTIAELGAFLAREAEAATPPAAPTTNPVAMAPPNGSAGLVRGT